MCLSGGWYSTNVRTQSISSYRRTVSKHRSQLWLLLHLFWKQSIFYSWLFNRRIPIYFLSIGKNRNQVREWEEREIFEFVLRFLGNPRSVSAWRTCFVANEYSELETFRRINLSFQLIFVLFLLKVTFEFKFKRKKMLRFRWLISKMLQQLNRIQVYFHRYPITQPNTTPFFVLASRFPCGLQQVLRPNKSG